MTIQGAIAELQNLLKVDDVPFYYKGGIEKVIETIQMEVAEQTEPNCSEKPNNCETCRNKGFEGCEQPCLGCGCCGLYEPKDEPQMREATAEERQAVRDYIESISEKTGVMFYGKDEPQTDCAWK